MRGLMYGLELSASAVMAPLLIVQGRQVRRATPRLAEPTGPRAGVWGVGPELNLLVVGDSSAAGVGVSVQTEGLAGRLAADLAADHTLRWSLAARSGATTRGVLAEPPAMQELPFDRCDCVVSVLGVNDVTAGRSVSGWLADQARLLGLYRQTFGARHVIFCGLPPVHGFPALPQPLRWALGGRARRFDERLRDWVSCEPDCSFQPVGFGLGPETMASDGFHPGAAVYSAWARALAARIRGLPRDP